MVVMVKDCKFIVFFFGWKAFRCDTCFFNLREFYFTHKFWLLVNLFECIIYSISCSIFFQWLFKFGASVVDILWRRNEFFFSFLHTCADGFSWSWKIYNLWKKNTNRKHNSSDVILHAWRGALSRSNPFIRP